MVRHFSLSNMSPDSHCSFSADDSADSAKISTTSLIYKLPCMNKHTITTNPQTGQITEVKGQYDGLGLGLIMASFINVGI